MARTATVPERRSLKIRSGDEVKVIAGKDRGKTGKVLRVEPRRERVYVEGLNMVKRHTRPQQVAGAQSEQQLGGVIEREGPLHVSNVMLLDSKGQPTQRADRARERQAAARRQAHGREDRLSEKTMTETENTATKARLKGRYLQEIRPALIERFGYSSVMQAPKLEKITLNMGVGMAKQDSKMLKAAQDQLARSPVSSRACAARASRSRRSNCARGCRWGWRSRCGENAAMSSSTGWCRSRSRGSATSAA